jgi:hypothetical protein
MSPFCVGQDPADIPIHYSFAGRMISRPAHPCYVYTFPEKREMSLIQCIIDFTVVIKQTNKKTAFPVSKRLCIQLRPKLLFFFHHIVLLY